MRWYTKEGDWIEESPEGLRIGLTKDAVNDLGDVSFVELPQMGRVLVSDEVAGVVEAVKAATDIHSPIGGRVVSVNTQVQKDPGLLNRDPEALGWLYCLEPLNREELSSLLDADQWAQWGTNT